MTDNSKLASYWEQKAAQVGGYQVFRSDGTPIVGDVRSKDSYTPKSSKLTYCHLDCCSTQRPPSSTPGLPERPSTFPASLEPEVHGWVLAEPRTDRRLKKRSQMMREQEAPVPYAMTD